MGLLARPMRAMIDHLGCRGLRLVVNRLRLSDRNLVLDHLNRLLSLLLRHAHDTRGRTLVRCRALAPGLLALADALR